MIQFQNQTKTFYLAALKYDGDAQWMVTLPHRSQDALEPQGGQHLTHVTPLRSQGTCLC